MPEVWRTLEGAAARRSRTPLGAAVQRTALRKGRLVAMFAMAHTLALPAYRMLRCGEDHVDIGGNASEKRFRVQRTTGLGVAARSLGFPLVRQEPAPA